MAQLDKTTYKDITRLAAEGDELTENEDFAGARRKYREAIKLLPGKAHEWEVGVWLQVAIGDTFFFAGVFDQALSYFAEAVEAPNGVGNPYIHLRLGQLFFELGDHEQAARELGIAYAAEGADIMADDDPKYLEFLKSRLDRKG